MTETIAPEDCTTMADVRSGVDALDRQIGDLMAVRFAYMRAAARIKPERGLVRDQERRDQVIANAAAHAEMQGYPATAAAAVWETLVEESIAYELTEFDARASSV